MFALMISPEAALLQRRVTVVRGLLLDAVEQTDALANHRLPALSAFYWSQFGPLEIQLYDTELRRDQLVYRIRLTRQYLNRGLPPDLPAIQTQTALKFAARHQALAAMRAKLGAAVQYLALPVLTEAESAELSTLYKQLVKALHPDLHPHQSAADKRMFLLVTTAYANGLLGLLRTIAALLAGRTEEVLSPAALRLQLARLVADLAQARQRQRALHQQWPLTIEDELADAAWRAHHETELQQALLQLKQQVAAKSVEYGRLVGDLGGEAHG